jgi:hypothetical protein
MSLQGLRSRVQLVVLVLLAVLCLAMLALACACFTDQPAKAADRASSLGGVLPALVEVWGVLTILAALTMPLVAHRVVRRARASPVLLQRFLF